MTASTFISRFIVNLDLTVFIGVKIFLSSTETSGSSVLDITSNKIEPIHGNAPKGNSEDEEAETF